jgi:hypothetical protein
MGAIMSGRMVLAGRHREPNVDEVWGRVSRQVEPGNKVWRCKATSKPRRTRHRREPLTFALFAALYREPRAVAVYLGCDGRRWWWAEVTVEMPVEQARSRRHDFDEEDVVDGFVDVRFTVDLFRPDLSRFMPIWKARRAAQLDSR